VRTLFLLRHAKSSWDDPTLADRDRPLAPRGRRAATLMADHCRSHGVRPSLILCSSALRARQTLELVEPALGNHVEVKVDDDVYWADDDDLLSRVHAIGDDVSSAMIVGHNPAMHHLALRLTGDGDRTAIAHLHTKFPTGALATLTLAKGGWRDVVPGRARLAALVIPRELR
jgi:phosphohistidine phosphatase